MIVIRDLNCNFAPYILGPQEKERPMKKRLNSFLKSPKLRSGLGFIITAAVLLEIIAAGQYLYTHSVLEKELEHRAETELTLKAIIIKGTVNKTRQMLRDYLGHR